MGFGKQEEQSWPSCLLSYGCQRGVIHTYIYFLILLTLHIHIFYFLGTDTETRVHHSAEIFPSLLSLPQTDIWMMQFPLPSFWNENILINQRSQRHLSISFSLTCALRLCYSRMKSKREKSGYAWRRENDLNKRKDTDRFPQRTKIHIDQKVILALKEN